MIESARQDLEIESKSLSLTNSPFLDLLQNMTLDILSFIDNKGGNAEEIRESQRKRGHSVELVDEIIQMYTDWVKSASLFSVSRCL